MKSSLNASKAGSNLGNQGEHMRKRCQRGAWVGRPWQRNSMNSLSLFTAEDVGESLMHTTNSLYQRGQKMGYQNNEELFAYI